MFFRTGLVLVLAASATAVLAAEPSAGEYKHLGVATCGSSVCHGKITPQPNSTVLLNESRTWLYCDRHAKSYTNLSKAPAQAIAAKLGIPATSKICLDCHTDNVQKFPDTKFQLSDGVGCEACHGGSERWIKSHAEKGAQHSDNVAKGMYPSEQPLKRAELCLSCHMGTRDKFTTHVIMGAGHPRLRFELQVNSFNQPAHVQIESATADDQCKERKGPIVDEKYHIEDMNLWVAGQIENARRYLELVQTRLPVQGSFLPDFALYDCYSCHHTMDKADKLRWSRGRAGPDIRPGTLRLQSYPLIMLQAMTEVLSPESLKEVTTESETLVRAGQTDVAAAQSAAQKLHAWIDSHEEWARRKYSKDDIARMRKLILRYAADDKTSDFQAAEQVVMGVESLSYAFGDHSQRDPALNQLYGAIKSFAAYDPAQFAALARGTLAQF